MGPPCRTGPNYINVLYQTLRDDWRCARVGVGICFVDYRLILLLVVFGILFLACFFLLRELEAYEKIEKYSNKYEERLLQPPFRAHTVRGQNHARASVTPGSQIAMFSMLVSVGVALFWAPNGIKADLGGFKPPYQCASCQWHQRQRLTHRATGPVKTKKGNM